MDVRPALATAAHALAAEGLVTAFGHVSVRLDAGRVAITPAVPLGSVRPDDDFPVVPLDATELPAGIPKEAWIHLAILRARPEVDAVCRAQPETVTAITAAGVPIRPLHGQGSFVGDVVPVFTDPRLVRDPERAGRLAATLGRADALVMRGNGAITTGATPGEAVARMWVLEASARLNAVAASAGTPEPLSIEEQEAWRTTSTELLGRIWSHLSAQHG
ncbi:HCOMODA/2-hydroxy-3-carboxy-muconic semialdehyde decarboxylase [Raineyella antarctica]|uniref:HCOMODA/2-hydroxy-3-carboxy-muconic semialdehyde decarboxylase n=1 Tax=Raineyella antarctica TaxID=1577474 RepID=A0A1G6GH59_9ACTN|nr:class II aldolase/adducin family protein [Raineyella antarctica]SDB81280.1 HCOMODA/2-hydroxy-3-carboxy-muconic semialdehyde decarboxylase [Raineyella antarctica]